MKEAFVMKPISEMDNENVEKKEKKLKEEAKEVFKKYEGENGAVVYADHESDVGLNLPLSYTALPLTQKNHVNKLNDLRNSINILEKKPSNFNPFRFSIDYKQSDNKSLITPEEKLEQAKNIKNKAIDFVNKWNKEFNIEIVKELAEDYKKTQELLNNIKRDYQKIALDESEEYQREYLSKLGEQFTDGHKILNQILENYKNL